MKCSKVCAKLLGESVDKKIWKVERNSRSKSTKLYETYMLLDQKENDHPVYFRFEVCEVDLFGRLHWEDLSFWGTIYHNDFSTDSMEPRFKLLTVADELQLQHLYQVHVCYSIPAGLRDQLLEMSIDAVHNLRMDSRGF